MGVDVRISHRRGRGVMGIGEKIEEVWVFAGVQVRWSWWWGSEGGWAKGDMRGGDGDGGQGMAVRRG